MAGSFFYYFNAYCPGSGFCSASEKGSLNLTTGEFTILSVELSDEGFYYHKFHVNSDNPNTGEKYEYNLDVYAKFKKNIQFIISNIVMELNQYVELQVAT